jgi:hypothetical protein
MTMGLWWPTFSWPWILALRPCLLLRPSSLAPSSREWRQRWHQQQRPWRQQVRCVMVRPPPRRPILVQGRARAMRARMAVIVVGGIGKKAIVASTINHCHSQQRRHWHCRLNPTAPPIDNNRYRRHQRSPSLLPHSQQQQLPEASGRCLLLTAAMAVIVDGSGS